VRPVYRLLDHTADIAFEVEAADWPSLLRAATAALGDLILAQRDDDGEAVPALEPRPLRVEGYDREDVLVAWLSASNLAYEQDGFVARDARLDVATDREAAGALLGRTTDPATEPPDRVVKAVTYHDLRVVAGVGGEPWRVTIVLDL
jgi:SHS2 domain-containing protein